MTESAPSPKLKSPARQRVLWISSAVLAFVVGTVVLRRLDPSAPQAPAPLPSLDVATQPPVVTDPSTAFTREQRGFSIATRLVDDAIAALDATLKQSPAADGWSAVLRLRALGPKAGPESIAAVAELWNASDSSWDRLGPAPSLLAAATKQAVAVALLEAGQQLPARDPTSPQDGIGASAPPSALALELELQTLRALRQPGPEQLRSLGELTAQAQTRLDLLLRNNDPLLAPEWQLAAAVLHGPGEIEPARQANLRRLWARLAETPPAGELLTQALRCEALASAVKTRQVEGRQAQATLQAELEHLRYLVNSDASEPGLEKQQAESFALRALRLGKSALVDAVASP